MNMIFKRKLPIPKDIKSQFPITPEMAKLKEERDKQIKDIFESKDNRLLLIIGPCSADNENAVLDYLQRLKKISLEVEDKIFIIPRVYTNKPRTTGDGYKGILHQPDPSKNPDMLKGIIAMRDIHIKAIKEVGFTCADEMLYPEIYRYLSDLLSYVSVGARSVEDQQHRLTASGLNIPVGMKNPTSGDLDVMLNSILAGQHSHTFIYRGWEVESLGNNLTHAILRGYKNFQGQMVGNYHYDDVAKLYELYSAKNLQNKSVIIDASHSNSNKNYMNQIEIVEDGLKTKKANSQLNNFIKGFMIESYIEDGNQKIGENVYGKSITDGCLGWEKTQNLIYSIAEKL